jgi:hypothetical protein
MAIEKFRFVSPGVQINEIDDSVIPPTPPAIGPVVIGRTARGPAMQPVRVSTIGELEKVFGAPSNGLNAATADVWRTGIPTAPTFATYAAKAFLRNSSPVTVIRLAGVEDNGTNATPGYTVSNAYHLFATSGSTATLAAVIYASSNVAFQVSNSVGGFSSANSGAYSTTGDLYLSASTGRTKIPVSFSTGSTSFLRNVLVTNPTLYAHPSVSTRTNYFLGESFENSISFVPTDMYITASSWTDFTDSSLDGETGYVTSDHASGSDPTDLFKFVGLNSGASLSREIKISIENVRPSKNTAVTKYGTFDVVVRKLFEAGSASTVLERFNGVNLDPSSSDYILKAIGDSYRQWDAVNGRYAEYGSYGNRSSYVRVELAVGDIPATALPHGFRMRAVPTVSAATLTASHPNVELFEDTVKVSVSKTKRFGLVASAKENADLVDIVSYKPVTLSMSGSLFSTRYIDCSNTTSGSVTYSGSAFYNSTDLLTSGVVLGFDMPVYGGFDGVSALEQEPIVNQYLLDGEDEATSNAYRAISQALDLVADPETLDLNLLCVPNLKEETLTSKMIQVCRTRGDCMAIIDLKGDYAHSWETNSGAESRPTSVTSVVSSLEGRSIDDSYGAAYFPAVFVPNEAIFMPASIAALGAFGGTEGRSALWFAPAGFNRGGLTESNSGIGVSRTVLTLNSSDKDALYAANINPIATFPNEGVVIFGQKTLQVTPSALDRVNVRRLLNFIKKEVSRISTRILFEPNVEDTWRGFKGQVEPFLANIRTNFGLEDARVILDETTTTADLVDRNIMYCKILLKPTRAIEFIAIDFVVTNSGASFTE